MKKDDLQSEHDGLREAVLKAVINQERWIEIQADPLFRMLTNGLRKEVDDKTVQLRAFLKADDTLRIRAEIVARQDFMVRVEVLAGNQRVLDARRAVREFEERYPMFARKDKPIGDEAVQSVGVEAVESDGVRRAFEGLVETIADAGADVTFISHDGMKTSMSASEARAIARKSKRASW